jgi:hypothetical protein
MDISLFLMGTEDLEKIILNDLEDLTKVAKEYGLKPATLIIGKFFIEVTAIKMLQGYLNIKTDLDWRFELAQNLDIISTLYTDQLSQLYSKCDKNNNILDYDPNKKISMFFDPDEEYLSLMCIKDSPETRQNLKNKKEVEFHKICFKPGEFLYLFEEILFN